MESEFKLANKKLDLFDSFEFKGVWWFPNLPEARLPGVLVRNAENFALELFDARGRITSTLGGAGHPFPYQAALVLGQLEDGKPCTLHQLCEMDRPRNSEGFEKSVAEPHCAFIGAHFASPDAIRFRSVNVEFNDLAAWMFDGSPFQREDIEEEGQFRGWRVSQRVPEPLFAHVPTIDANVGFSYSASTSGSLTTHELSVQPSVTIYPTTTQSFEWYLGVIRDVQNWLTLLIGKPVQPSGIEASTEQYRTAQVLPSWMGKRREEPLSPTFVRVKLPAVRSEIEGLLRAWFERSERLRDVYNLFFGAVHAEGMYLESHYLSLIQAVEAFSRSTTTSTYVSQEKYEAIRAALALAIPPDTTPDLKASLQNRIKYGNEYSLRKRLNELLKSLEPPTLELICDDRQLYVEKVVATRNFLTHYTSELRSQAWHEDKLFQVCQSLTVLLTLFLFREVGFTEQRIRDLLNGHSSTRQIIAMYKEQL